MDGGLAAAAGADGAAAVADAAGGGDAGDAGRDAPECGGDALPAPAETPEGPTTEQTENAGGQGESRPLSVVAADENGYTRVGDVFIKNSSRQTVEGIVFDGTFAAALGEDAPQVLIVHTHGSEAYTMPPGEEYEDTGELSDGGCQRERDTGGR